MKVVGMIPARMASTRFYGKPLKKICGCTMIEHVYMRSKLCTILDDLYVATCDKEIYNEVVSFGGKAIMTSPEHKTSSDRIAEACMNVNSRADIVVNIQGDEPLIYPDMIELAVRPFFTDSNLVCTNLVAEIDNEEDFNNPNVIKAVKDNNDYALYFSREPIPSRKKCQEAYTRYKQVCILPFRREFLLKFVSMPPTPLEHVESVDMLRILENGYKIKLVKTSYQTMGVDDERDRLRAEKLMQEDELYKLYCH